MRAGYFIIFLLCLGAVYAFEPGDINNDGKVDLQDLLRVTSHTGRNKPYNVGADLNGDGKVNVYDLVHVGRHWGKQYGTGAISTPTNLAATPLNEVQVLLNWTPVPGATGYKVTRNGIPIVTAKPINVSSFVDRPLEADKTYAYTVIAFNAAKAESLSASVSTKTPAIALPALPELPRKYVDTTMPVQSGKIISVPGGNATAFNKALLDAQPGDIIELQAGTVYDGSFMLPAKANPNNQWIIIRSSRWQELPPEGTRVTPAHAALMPAIQGGKRNARILQARPAASHYRLVGVEIVVDPTVRSGVLTTMVELEDNTTLENIPHHIVFDRTYIHGQDYSNMLRCVTINNAWTAIIDSYLDNCHAVGFDSQAIYGSSGPGPFKIVNNHLAGAGETVMFGGAPAGAPWRLPSDIEIRYNHFYKPAQWERTPYVVIDGKNRTWTVKNIFELKHGQRILVEGNVFENVWPDAQIGVAINIKSENRDQKKEEALGVYYSVTQDVTFRNNLITNATHGLQLIGGASTKEKSGELNTNKMLFQNNLFANGGRNWQGGGVYDLIIEQNTFLGGGGWMPSGNNRVIIRNNIVNNGLKSSSVPEGWGSLYSFSDLTFEGNAFTGATDKSTYPASSLFTNGIDAVGFVNPTAENYALSSSSPLKGKGVGGKDPGVDYAQLQAAIAGVREGTPAQRFSAVAPVSIG